MNQTRKYRINGESRLNMALELIPGAVEYIVSLNPHDFARLRNPIMRKFMSPRISLRRVAVMAGIGEDELLAGLAALGGNVEISSRPTVALNQPLELPQSPTIAPAWMHGISDTEIKWVDLLAIDDHQGDPFPPVSMAVKEMAPGTVIGIRHRWQPQPFYDVWQRMGIQWFASQANADEWHIYVFKPVGFSHKYI